MLKTILFVFFALAYATTMKAQYISEVLEYKPAPGQLINSAPWGTPNSANSLVGGVRGSVCLGAFGGYIVFKFENPVENHPNNPFGVDFTIFGNPLNDWSEPGIVSVMKDENKNGMPDDTWYELAGSDYFFSSTIYNYEVTYTNPRETTSADVPWVDNQDNSGLIPANNFHTQPYYPLTDSFPDISPDYYTLKGTKITADVDMSNQIFIKSYRKAFGYVDNQLRGGTPYTLPDNPYTPEKENSGGDAFDIGWAVDENGNYVDLDMVHFVKIHNAVLANAGRLGEIATEITGAIDIAPDESVTGELDFIHLKKIPDTVYTNKFPVEVFAYHKGRWQKDRMINWSSDNEGVSINNENILYSETTGKITITAALADKPDITANAATYINSLEINTKIQDITVKENAADTTIDLSKLFTEPDDMQAHISIIIESGVVDTVVSATISNQKLNLSFLKRGLSTLVLKGEANGKSAYTSIRLVVNDTLSARCTKTKQLPICLAPNPANDFITIKGVKKATLLIYDLFGKPVIQVSEYSGEILPVNQLKPGVYLLRITDRRHDDMMKFVKKQR